MLGTMKNKIHTEKTKQSDTRILWIGLGVLTLAGGITYYFYTKKKASEEEELVLGENNGVSFSTSTSSSSNTTAPISRSRFRCSSRSYPLGYGTCHGDVEILQKYLKIYKEDLGSSGKNKDGVDGMFGSKTVKAARKRLGKASFSKEDIEGMKTSIQMIRP